ncbi:MAG: DMT family transporter, partial [Phycisphaerae bacterium]
SWQVAGFRSALAAAALLVALPAARRGWSRRGLLVAGGYSAMLILFVSANKLTTAMNTIFLQDTGPFYVLALSPALLGERIHKRDLVVMGLILAGLSLFFISSESPQATAPRPLLGNVLAALSGLGWAMTLIGLRWLGKSSRTADVSLSAVAMGNLLTAAVCLPMALPVAPADHTLRNWLLMAFLGVFQIGLAYVFLAGGLARVPAFTASILLLLEPVFSPVWTFLLHREVPNAWAAAGGALILGATVAKAWTPAPSEPPRREEP